MKITECYIENFGIISKQKFTFNDGFNCFYADNGTGKTTLSVFIKAMLYGLGDTRKQDPLENERRRYSPWSGARASGSMSFVLRGKGYRIERSFGKKPSEDEFALYDLKTGLISKDFSERIGEEIFEINEGGFERTVFLSERDLPHDEDDGVIAAKLSDLSGVDADLAGFSAAILRLDERRRNLQKRGGGGRLADLKAEISRQEKDIEAGIELSARKKTLEEELSKAKEERDNLLAKRTELLERVKNARASGGKSQKDSRAGFSEALFPILTLASLICAFFISPLFYIPSALLLTVSLASLLFPRQRNKAKSGANGHTAEEEILLITDKSIRLEAKITAAESELASIAPYLGAAESLGEDYKKLRQEYENAENELSAVKLAMEFLERAKASITAKYLGRTRSLLLEYVKKIDGADAPSPDMDTDFSLSVYENGRARVADAYSKGTRKLYAFAARLAFAESLYSGELPFLILDDPFVYLDDPRCKKALGLLLEISKKRQVIYFTASRSRCT